MPSLCWVLSKWKRLGKTYSIGWCFHVNFVTINHKSWVISNAQQFYYDSLVTWFSILQHNISYLLFSQTSLILASWFIGKTEALEQMLLRLPHHQIYKPVCKHSIRFVFPPVTMKDKILILSETPSTHPGVLSPLIFSRISLHQLSPHYPSFPLITSMLWNFIFLVCF